MLPFVTMTEARAKLEALKARKFRALVRHADAHAPYYADIIRERGIDIENCTPADFPILSKSILMANFDAIVTDSRVSKLKVGEFLKHSVDPKDLLFEQLTVMHTSGTSGEVGYFLYAPADYARLRAAALHNRKLFRRAFPLRWRLRRLKVAFYGATGGHFAGVTGVTSMQRGLAQLFVKARAFEVNSPLPAVVAQLNHFRPDILSGYTTALKMLCDEQRAGRLDIRPRVVSATGEMVTKADLEYLSSSFGGATASSLYACTEHLMLGISNPDGESMTLIDDNLIFEFYEDHSLITNLYNYTMPLIRYRMSDILRPISAPQSRYILIETLVGRIEQMPAFLNVAGVRDFISPHTINEIFVDGVTRFQMQLTGPTSFSFPICLAGSLNSASRAEAVAGVKARLAEILQQKGLGNVTFDVPVVAEIALNAHTRKFQLVVSHRTES